MGMLREGMEALKALPWSDADASGAARRGQEAQTTAQTSSESQQPPDREPGSSSRGGGRGYEGPTGMPPTGEASPRYPGPVTRLGSTESLSHPTARLLLPSSKHSPFLPRRGFSWPSSKPCDAEGGREVTFKPRHSCSRGGGASVKPRGSIPKWTRPRSGSIPARAP